MRVWRLETEAGEGPWTSGELARVRAALDRAGVWYRDPGEMPGPSCDRGVRKHIGLVGEHHFIPAGWGEKSTRFGFSSLRQMRLAFGREVRLAAARQGKLKLRLYAVPFENVRFGAAQVTFRRDTARLLASFAPDHHDPKRTRAAA